MGRFISLAVALALALVLTAFPADPAARSYTSTAGGPPALGRSYEEPAYARGYADGFRHAQDDRFDRRRYDPIGHRDYRSGDQGFYRSYGSREAYRNNYRAGFRAGYDAGYRDGTGRRR